MCSTSPHFSLLILMLSFTFTARTALSATFTLVNQCPYTVWPGILSGAGTQPLSTTGFALSSGDSLPVSVPPSWSGRIWGRTLCSQDSTTGKFTCATADCGSGAVECSGAGAVPPATLAEFTLNGAGGLDFYDVSLVDGYNLPMLVVPQGGNCSSTGCVGDLNESCPSELKVVSGASTSGGECVACRSACEAFGDPKYCCSGAYATPDTCGPTQYSQVFKNACPRAYSYAYDDQSSTFTCASADYIITFCPTPSASKKASGEAIAGAGSVSLVSNGAHVTTQFSCRHLIFLANTILQLWRWHY
ncbi:thaumatin-like protein 1b [Salvia miltiorrhiza]|uniref:thaumatin-like protein 1b n=1 Tax=Salvia miltiorrhiza TaxID=226208 RepID=UPI0025ACDCC8|nr:thaumatin-like protein 1b [Salvia miltiorrhiza]XP_057809618.1 thaumatin-like protein 1b [Salvia miltiorrhiza]